jgi:hypothetical protein
MTSIFDRLEEEIKRARFRKDTTLVARLQEARREIEYFRWAIDEIAALEDKHIPRSFRVFVDLTRKDEKIGAAHPLLAPDGISNFMMRRKINVANVK